MESSSRAGLIPVRQYFLPSRRGFLRAAGAAAALAAGGLPHRPAAAATKLTFIGWQGYETFLEAGDFGKARGLELEKSYISNADEVTTKLRLGSAQVDLCTPYFIYDHFLADEQLIAEIDTARIPRFKAIHPTILKICEPNMAKDGKWYAVPMTYGSICMVYNADQAAAPTSWKDMLKPEYKGKAAITADYPGNMFAWARVAGVKQPTLMTHEELKKTVELLIDLKRNHLRAIAPSYGDLVNMLSAKEVVIAQGWEPVASWVGNAANIRIAYPAEQSMGFIEGYAIGQGSGNVDAAYGYIDNALSVAGQLAGAEANSMPVVVADAMAQASAANKALYGYDALDDYFHVKTDVVPMYPLKPDGVHAVWDDYQEAWEKVLKG
jgi:spermidine/putrescine-binding protein